MLVEDNSNPMQVEHEGPYSTGMKMWVTQPGRGPQEARELAEVKGNRKWIEEKS